MISKKARDILTALVQGVDPETAEELTGNSVLQKAVVLRALLAGISALDLNAAREGRRAALPVNVGNPWSSDEERQLATDFHRGDSVALIAEKLGRTVRAIESRLERLGLLEKGQRVTESFFDSNG